jgi:coenzyme F420-0:L-glutamate ligase / coenzyme F420-1:gamma-L-glutamate ligase
MPRACNAGSAAFPLAFSSSRYEPSGHRLYAADGVKKGMPNAGAMPSLELMALSGFPLVQPGTNLLELICHLTQTHGPQLMDHDVVVIAQKVISKAEGRYVDLAGVTPGEEALALAFKVRKDPRLVEVILGESRRILRHRPGVMIVEHKLGFVVANAGVDQSNVDPEAGNTPVLLLPENPDGSAQRLHDGFRQRFNKKLGVVINDSFGRAWRLGTVGVALGAAGFPALRDLRGQPDLYGRQLQVTQTGFADEIAAAASLLMGQGNEATPVVVVRGLRWPEQLLPASALLRGSEEDLFR